MSNLPTAVTLPISEILPYPNNPRKITEQSIAAVKQSIESYGYVQPIAIRKATKEIIVGHTRFEALKRMGVKEVQVYLLDISEEKAREYRLIDNRTGEMTEWDHSTLIQELREFEKDLLDTYFPEVDLEIGLLQEVAVTQDDVDRGALKAARVKEAPIIPTTDVVCPSCYHTFRVKTASLPGVTYDDVKELTEQLEG